MAERPEPTDRVEPAGPAGPVDPADPRVRWAALARAASLGRPAALAGDRLVEVVEPLAPLLARGGLVRGSTVACTGPAAVSLGVALAAGASAAGAWTGVVGVPALGLAAVAELGVAMERLLLVAEPPPGSWATVVAAVIDGVDVVIVGSVAARAGEVRRLQARLASRGGVLVVTGSPGPLAVDLTVRTVAASWEGLHHGHGRLAARRVVVEAAGRRQPSPRRIELWLPGASGSVAAVRDSASVRDSTSVRDDVAVHDGAAATGRSLPGDEPPGAVGVRVARAG